VAAAIICGHRARKQIRGNPSLSGQGLAMAALVVGYLLLALNLVGIFLALGWIR
jgi:uncharacterized protein DUF4190